MENAEAVARNTFAITTSQLRHAHSITLRVATCGVSPFAGRERREQTSIDMAIQREAQWRTEASCT